MLKKILFNSNSNSKRGDVIQKYFVSLGNFTTVSLYTQSQFHLHVLNTKGVFVCLYRTCHFITELLIYFNI